MTLVAPVPGPGAITDSRWGLARLYGPSGLAARSSSCIGTPLRSRAGADTPFSLGNRRYREDLGAKPRALRLIP